MRHNGGYTCVRSLAAATVLAAASLGAGVAHAHTDRDAPSFSKLVVALDGRIAPRCELGAGGAIDFGELTGGESVTAVVGFACNVPFDISFQSARGGLAHVTMPTGQGPFAGTLGYALDVTIPTLSPTPRTLHAHYESRSLVGRRTLSSDAAIAAGGAQLVFRTDAPQGAGLLAGDYTETMSVTVTPRF